MPRLDKYSRARFVEFPLAACHAAHRGVPTRLPCGRRRIDDRRQRRGFIHPAIPEHRIETCRDLFVQRDARIHHQPTHAIGGRTRGFAMQITHSPSGEQRNFDRAQELRPSELRALRIQSFRPPTQLRHCPLVELRRESRAIHRVEQRLFEEWVGERAEVESGASDHNHLLRSRLGDPARRIVGPSGSGPPVGRIGDIDTTVYHRRTVSGRWLCRPDIETAIHLPRVSAHDRQVVSRGKRHRESRLPGSGGTADDAKDGSRRRRLAGTVHGGHEGETYLRPKRRSSSSQLNCTIVLRP